MHAKALRAYMKRNKINQSNLADLIGADRHQVSRWMNGQVPNTKNLRNISRSLGIPMSDLV